ncbi:MAG: hypothetical protein MT490_03415 [Sphingomonas sp.]|uniref:hypothetical protein n=1 Tax=Sphingomonas sp. TaxID=28214 RepID=UPI002276E107|nr:hypothetical protein [Sphingomonas sp.]MCX8474825.1 hypothetical protein [Sphingomonas sp.]
MNVKIFAVAIAAAFLVSASFTATPTTPPVPQSSNACLLEGEIMSEFVKDCSQTSMPISAAAYAAQCRENESAGLKATPMKTCPAQAQASCINPFGQQITTFYYARSPQQLAATKQSCVAQRGKWVERP